MDSMGEPKRRSPQRSIINPPEFRKHYCFPSMATNAVSREIRRLVHMRPVTVTISLGGGWNDGGLAWDHGLIEGEEDGRNQTGLQG